ncbi:YafY family transcriptional regulator [Aminipila butyrica]|uniref:YafY family transcriptional regulator n=1 Tax=Aminipila butyrica TaxID=433296 RepID=A0A858BV18_9FIRM|nr:YafY family protein [Aminipila butyrica]QIB69232.1 YafY family transcriptional regulator [Aminipila butyrica]
MNKSERLQDMMLFLNDKNSFNLKDLMNNYHISKSTALRDVQSLELIGMPIYSQPGRNGYYGILSNKLLSPMVFNMDEVFALYFSMLTLRDYETTPFHLSVEKLKKKFETCLSPEKIDMLHRVESVFRLASIQHHNPCPFLSDVLQYAIEEKVSKVLYEKKGIPTNYFVQFFNISSAYGQWYATGCNVESDSPQVFRCDKILAMEEANQYQAKPLAQFLKPAHVLYKAPDAIDFEIKLSKKGVDLFYKEHYPSMKLSWESGEYFLRGFYNKGEENFIANYFIGYGETILSVYPPSLKSLIIQKADALRNYFAEM